MEVTDARLIIVTESSQVSEARRAVSSIAANQGFDQKAIDRVALVTTELATNLVKHSSEGGVLIAQGLSQGADVGIEIFSLDKGPGMVVQDCLKDGFSTTSTLGNGLGAISRLSTIVDIESTARFGTAVQTRLWFNKREQAENKDFGGLTVPLQGEQLSGDKWLVCRADQILYCLLVDGLGHGFEAHEAATLACDCFKKNLRLSPAPMMKALHEALRGSRGAVAATARIDFANRKLDFAGMGNITALLLDHERTRHLVSLNGTLGYEFRKVTEFELPWTNESTLIMHSDGISSKLSEHLLARRNESAGVLAASLYLHYAKKTDDATVLVAKECK